MSSRVREAGVMEVLTGSGLGGRLVMPVGELVAVVVMLGRLEVAEAVGALAVVVARLEEAEAAGEGGEWEMAGGRAW